MEEYESLYLALDKSGTKPWEVLNLSEEETVQRVQRSINEIRRFKAELIKNVPHPSKFTHSNSISTGCLELDELLGGGLARGYVTEICGPAAAGKTCLACQIAVQNSQSCLYLSTENNAKALVTRMQSIAKFKKRNFNDCKFLWPHSLAEIRIALNKIRNSTSIMVVIIDSITEALTEQRKVAAELEELNLRKAAFDFNIAIVLINQVRDSKRSAPDLPDYHYYVQEQLVEGDAMPHAEFRRKSANGWSLSRHISTRLMLSRPGSSTTREATLVFSRHAEPKTLKLNMTEIGLISYDENLKF